MIGVSTSSVREHYLYSTLVLYFDTQAEPRQLFPSKRSMRIKDVVVEAPAAGLSLYE
jgi:hypothetical protein